MSPLYNQAGEIVGAIESIRDITEIKKTEQELWRSEERYRSIVNDQTEMIMRFTPDGTITFTNESFRHNFSPLFDLTEIGWKKIYEIMRFKKCEPLQDFLLSLSPHSPIREIERQIINKNGELYCHVWVVRALFDKSEQPVEYQVVGRDITIQKRSELALAESEGRLRSFIENTRDSFCVTDEEGVVIEWNPGAEHISGISKNEALGMKIWDITFQMLPPERQTQERKENIEQISRTMFETGVPAFEDPRIIEVHRPDGSRVIARQLLLPIKTDKGFRFYSVSQDITEEKLAEEAIRESEKKYRDLSDLLPQMVFELDLKFQLIYANRQARVIFGYSEEDVNRGINVLSLFDPAQHARIREYARMQIEGKSYEPQEYTAIRKDGSFFPVIIYSSPCYHNNILTGFRGAIADISARKKLEDEIRENEEKFRRFANNSRDMLYRMSLPDGTYDYVSPASQSLTGYSPEGFYADPALMRRLIHPACQERFQQEWTALIEKNIPPSSEYQIVDRAGKTRWFNQRNILVTNEQGECIALEGNVTDVTECKDTQRNFKRCEQRLFAVTMNTGFWIWEVNAEGIYTYASPAVEHILGYKPEDLVGKIHFYELFDPSVHETLREEIDHIFNSHHSFRDVIHFNLHRNGSQIILKTSGIAMFDDDGVFCGYCCVDEDITGQKRDLDTLRKVDTCSIS